MSEEPKAETPDWIKEALDKLFIHVNSIPKCEHDFQGWREFDDGHGGEQFCSKCGLGAMAHTLSLDI